MTQPDFANFREIELDDNITDSNQPLAIKLEDIFLKTLILPDEDIQLPVLIAYTLLPSAMCTVIPILLLNGDKGSGKSTAMKIIGAVHNQPLLSATTSAVALRNHINESRWSHPQLLEGEKNCCVLFDNVGTETFKNEFLYLFFLNGYDRETDSVMISSGVSGVNTTFKVFSPKVLSTIHPILNSPDFEELARRCMVIKFKSLENFSSEEVKLIALTPADTINLKVLNENYHTFWNNEENLKEFATNKKRVLKQWKKNGLPTGFNSATWIISIDILVTGCALSMWDINGGLSYLRSYWEWYETTGKPVQSPLFLLLQEYIAKEEEIAEKLGQEKTELGAKELKVLVMDAAKNGQLDKEVRASLIGDTMRQLGWTLDMNRKKQLVWRKSK